MTIARVATMIHRSHPDERLALGWGECVDVIAAGLRADLTSVTERSVTPCSTKAFHNRLSDILGIDVDRITRVYCLACGCTVRQAGGACWNCQAKEQLSRA
jgi:hypothetical protein